MIAIALACNPKLMMADEPTTALDVTIQAQILETMARLSKELGTAVIIITHNLGVVARYADRVNVMYAGRVVENSLGAGEAAGHDPRHPYTLGLLRSVPRLERKGAQGQAGANRGPAARPDSARRRLLVPAALPLRRRCLRSVAARTAAGG